MTTYNRPQIELKESNYNDPKSNGWSIMICGREAGDGKFLGDGSFVSLDLRPETTRVQAIQIIELLQDHCRHIGHTQID